MEFDFDERPLSFTKIPAAGLYIDLNKTYEVRQDGCCGHLLWFSESEKIGENSKEHYFLKGIELFTQIQFMLNNTDDKYIIDRKVTDQKTIYGGLIGKGAMERFMSTSKIFYSRKYANIKAIKPYGMYIDLNRKYKITIDPYMHDITGYKEAKNDSESKNDRTYTGFELLRMMTVAYWDMRDSDGTTIVGRIRNEDTITYTSFTENYRMTEYMQGIYEDPVFDE